MNLQEQICPICNEGRLEQRVGENHVTYNGQSTWLDSHYAVCSVCACEQASASQTRTNKRAMIAFKKQVDGLLTGTQLKALRQRLGINQSQAAVLFGGGPVAFSKYENDDIMQSASMDQLLRVADNFPEVLTFLAVKAGVKLEPSRIRLDSKKADKRFQLRRVKVIKVFKQSSATRRILHPI